MWANSLPTISTFIVNFSKKMKDCNGHFNEHLQDMKCVRCQEYNSCYTNTLKRKTPEKNEKEEVAVEKDQTRLSI